MSQGNSLYNHHKQKFFLKKMKDRNENKSKGWYEMRKGNLK
jgi:hypothetical protein